MSRHEEDYYFAYLQKKHTDETRNSSEFFGRMMGYMLPIAFLVVVGMLLHRGIISLIENGINIIKFMIG